MSTRTTLHRLALASAVAAMLAAAAPNVFAQAADTPATPPVSTPAGPTSTTPDNANTTTPSATAMPSDSTAPAPMSTMPATTPPASSMGTSNVPTPPMNLPTDYSILNNSVFDSVDIQKARARGLTESQIATIVKISKDTGYSFGDVSAKVEAGQTFASLATMYGLKLGDVYSNDKEKQEVSDYDALSQYEASLSKNSSGMSSMPMTNSTMPPMAPSTPPMAPTGMSASSSQLDIVDTAMAAKNLTTLVKALQAAGLVETLKGAGPFTVFAPDNKAFSKLPAGALDALMADPAKLKQVLTYHVIPGNIMAADAMNMTSPTSPPTVEGSTLQVTKGRKGKLKINDATVTKADIKASNGTIHIIDTVLMPPAAATTDTTVTPAAPMDATPPAAPGATPPAAPATPGTTTTPPAPAPAMPTTPGQ